MRGREGAIAAPLVELFASWQGEGRFVGAPTWFVRAAGCPLRCRYCDTPESYRAPRRVPVLAAFGEPAGDLANPVLPGDALRARERIGWPTQWVSLTGGEPLLYPRFGVALFELARSEGFRTHLETAAVDPEALEIVLPATDHLAMDYKLPGTLLDEWTGQDRHLACLELAAASTCTIDVKIVVTAGADANAYRVFLDRSAELRERFLLVLQPVSPALAEPAPCPPGKLAEFFALARDRRFETRVIPQVHRMLGVR